MTRMRNKKLKPQNRIAKKHREERIGFAGPFFMPITQKKEIGAILSYSICRKRVDFKSFHKISYI